MISVDIKNETTSSSPLNLSIPDEEPTLSFSELLKGVKSSKKDDKLIQNGTVVLALEGDKKQAPALNTKTKTHSKTQDLQSLLKNTSTKSTQETKSTKEEPLELNPKLMSTLSSKEIKTLVSDAKEYLKSKILQSDGYKNSQIKELPQTLKGLAQLAKKFDIDVSKITVEEVQTKETNTTPKIAVEVKELKSQLKPELQTKEPKQQAVIEQKAEIKDVKNDLEVKDKKPQPKLEQILEQKAQIPTPKNESGIKEIKVQPKHEQIPEQKAQINTLKNEPEIKEIKAQPKLEDTIDDKIEQKIQVKTPKDEVPSKDIKPQPRAEQVPQQNSEIKAVKSTPLFKAQNSIEVVTTQQIVQTKVNSSVKVELKTPREKADETLKLLLRGEKPSMNTSLTADFSVATAKVIAPLASSEAHKSLESLLRGDSSNSDDNLNTIKSEQLLSHKADSFEIKLNEAKQMIKYISSDVKTAIEDYKSPFTRVKVQLNPQKLGEIELTVVQRGKNLHVNISSNNSAINTLSMNANELRTQLSNNGINNASLNFNNHSQNSDSNASQQQNSRQNENQAHEEYNYFENEDANEEILNSLEIIVPQYG